MFCVMTSLICLLPYRNDKKKVISLKPTQRILKKNSSQIIDFRFGVSADLDVIIFS